MLLARRGLGYVEDAPDGRDFSFEALRLPQGLPLQNVDLSSFVIDVLDQGQAGSCTAHGTAQALRMSLTARRKAAGIAFPDVPLASRAALYYWARSYDGNELIDDGAQIRNVFKAIRTMGYFPEELWPYTDDTNQGSRLFQRPPIETDRLAIDQKPKSFSAEYRRIISTGDKRLEAIMRSHGEARPVVFGCAVSDAFCRDAFDASAPLGPPAVEDVAGLHCMVTAGHRTVNGQVWVRVLNSWSADFADHGYFWMSPAYVAEWMDVWSVDCEEEISR